MSALLLAGLGFLAGLLLPRGRRRAMLLEQRRSTVRALRRLRAMMSDVAEVADPPDVQRLVADALTDVLHLRRCTFEPSRGPAQALPLPELSPDGELAARVVHRVPRGVVLPEAAAIPARHGRFVLSGSPTGCTLEERIVATAMVAVASNWQLRRYWQPPWRPEGAGAASTASAASCQAAASEDSPARSARRR